MEGPGGGGAAAVIGNVAQIASTVLPEIAPEVYLIMGIIQAHRRAKNGQWPTPEEVQSIYDGVTQSIKDVWATWVPSGR